jgi:hypothetical protein
MIWMDGTLTTYSISSRLTWQKTPDALADLTHPLRAGFFMTKRGGECPCSNQQSEFPMHTPFERRRMEWWFAGVTLGLGLWFALPWVSMSTDAYSHLLAWLREDEWAIVLGTTGLAHMTSLYVNGRRWWTPFARTMMLVINAMCYAVLAVGFMSEYWPTSATFTYGVGMCSAAVICIYFAVKDCVHALEVRNAH